MTAITRRRFALDEPPSAGLPRPQPRRAPGARGGCSSAAGPGLMQHLTPILPSTDRGTVNGGAIKVGPAAGDYSRHGRTA